MAKPIELPFGLMIGVGQRNRVLEGRAYCIHLANTVERLCAAAMSGSASMSGDAACFPITWGNLVTDRVSIGGNVIPFCLSACFHYSCWTEWPLTSTFCMYTDHDRSSHGIEGQGWRLGLGSRFETRSVGPRSSIEDAFLVGEDKRHKLRVRWRRAREILMTHTDADTVDARNITRCQDWWRAVLSPATLPQHHHLLLRGKILA